MAVDNSVQYLCVRVKGQWLGIDVHNVMEIATPGEKGLSKLMDDSNIMNYNGKDIPAVYLNELLSGDPVKYQKSNRVLISESNDQKYGLVVDSAEEIIRTTKDNLKPLTNVKGLTDSAFKGTINIDDREIKILSLRNLVELIGTNG